MGSMDAKKSLRVIIVLLLLMVWRVLILNVKKRFGWDVLFLPYLFLLAVEVLNNFLFFGMLEGHF
jgi:diacylglycerol kinase